MITKTIKDVKVEKIWYGWVGIAHLKDGKAIIIKWWALPESTVDIKVVKQKKDYIEGHIIATTSYNDKYADGDIFCPHFFIPLWISEQNKNTCKIWCWWCKWQLMTYETQLELKQSIIVDGFKKIENTIGDLPIKPIIGSPLSRWYRNKIEFSFWVYISEREQIKSNWNLWFHKQWEFSKIVDIASCWLISDKANMVFEKIKGLCFASWLPTHDQKTHQWFFRHLVIREGCNTNQLLVNLAVAEKSLQEKQKEEWEHLQETFKKDPLLQNEVTCFVISYNNWLWDIVKWPDTQTRTLRWEWHIYEKLIFEEKEITFRVSPYSFFQTNTLWAETLFTTAKKMIGEIKWNVLDLYCWTGSIGISFLKQGIGENVIGIDIVPDAITDARHNAKINGIEDKCLFLAAAAEKALQQQHEIYDKIQNIELVVIDPPREGIHKNVGEFLVNLKKTYDYKLLYISCNPITMARDIQLLIQEWFSLKTIQPVDMFPHTHHIECIWVLQ